MRRVREEDKGQGALYDEGTRIIACSHKCTLGAAFSISFNSVSVIISNPIWVSRPAAFILKIINQGKRKESLESMGMNSTLTEV